MGRFPLLLAVIVLSFGGFVVYNLFFRPPPSSSEVISLLTAQPMPGVVSMVDGSTVATPAAAPLRVVTITPFANGVIAVYTNDRGQGSGYIRRGWLGWNFYIHSWGPISAMSTGETVVYEHEQEYASHGSRFGEVVWGMRRSPGAAVARVQFDDGTTLSQTIAQDFSIVTDQHGAACVLEVLDANNTVLERHALTPRTPFDVSDEFYDCKLQP